YDMAGNVSERRLVVNLNQTELPGPELVNPAKNQSMKSPAITFEWKETDGAADYILSVSDPDLKTTTYAVTKGNDSANVKWNVVLTKQGRYEWKVTPRDAVGNLGIASSIQVFYYDKE